MRKSVDLLVKGIDVTASTQSQALSYLREDAAEFRRQCDYENGGVEDTDEEPNENADDLAFDVSVAIPRGKGERTWTGEAVFTVVVDAATDEDAFAAALALVTA